MLKHQHNDKETRFSVFVCVTQVDKRSNKRTKTRVFRCVFSPSFYSFFFQVVFVTVPFILGIEHSCTCVTRVIINVFNHVETNTYTFSVHFARYTVLVPS